MLKKVFCSNIVNCSFPEFCEKSDFLNSWRDTPIEQWVTRSFTAPSSPSMPPMHGRGFAVLPPLQAAVALGVHWPALAGFPGPVVLGCWCWIVEVEEQCRQLHFPTSGPELNPPPGTGHHPTGGRRIPLIVAREANKRQPMLHVESDCRQVR